MVEECCIAGDDAGRLELADSAKARRRAEPDSGREFVVGEPPIDLQLAENCVVKLIPGC